jgi:cobalt-zinc-cadmium efflux system protein
MGSDHRTPPASPAPGASAAGEAATARGGHDHAGHDHGTAALVRQGATRVLDVALAANAVMLVAQVVVGLLAGSLAVLADAVHQGTDVAALGLARLAVTLARRPAGSSYTYGYRQVEVLVAGINAFLLAASAVWVGIEAVDRLGTTRELEGTLVAAIGVLGLAVNGGSAVLLARRAGASLNLRAAGWHLTADAAGSLGVVVVGVAALAGSDAAARTLDPLVAGAIALTALWAAGRLVRGVLRHLLHAVPDRVDLAAVEATLRAHEAVQDVHHLHVWAIGDAEVALSAHLVVGEEADLHATREVVDELGHELAHLGVSHPTLQVECHACD